MLLTGDEIIVARDAGEIVIDPFVPENVNTASYDVSLGPFCYRQAIGSFPNRYNPYDREHVGTTWHLKQAVPASSLSSTKGIDEEDFVIPIGPKEIILAHTLEFIGSVPRPGGISITTQMHSRSSSVRNCIDVCGSGGFGDAGFCGRWTMEVVNHSRHYTTYLVVGRRLAQISFWRTTPVLRDYAQEGKYHDGMALTELKKNWTPDLMLSRMYQDREVGEKNPHQDLIHKLIHKYPIEE